MPTITITPDQIDDLGVMAKLLGYDEVWRQLHARMGGDTELDDFSRPIKILETTTFDSIEDAFGQMDPHAFFDKLLCSYTVGNLAQITYFLSGIYGGGIRNADTDLRQGIEFMTWLTKGNNRAPDLIQEAADLMVSAVSVVRAFRPPVEDD